MKPCCYRDTDEQGNERKQCRNVHPDAYGDCDGLGGQLGPAGTCCATPTVGPIMECPGDVSGGACWLCEWEVDHGLIKAPCCFAALSGGPQWFGNDFVIYPEQCSASCGGEPYVSEEDCLAEEPREQECIRAGEDRAPPYENAHRWTLNTMGTVVFGLTKVTDEWRSLEGEDWANVMGYTYGLSTHLTRPREPDTPENACGHAIGRFTMLDDGYVYMETCSLPDVNNLDSFRRSYGMLRTFDEADPALGIEAGYQYWVTCIRLPAWTEVLYRSHQLRCSSVPV